jgi:hypothetical protein
MRRMGCNSDGHQVRELAKMATTDVGLFIDGLSLWISKIDIFCCQSRSSNAKYFQHLAVVRGT